MFVHSPHQQKSCPAALYLSQQVHLVGLSYGGGGDRITKRLMRWPNKAFLSTQPLMFSEYSRKSFSDLSVYYA